MSDKTNPLDRLTRPGGRPISDDETIPVLTERLTLPSLDLDISLPKPPPPVSAPAPAPTRIPVAAPAPPPPLAPGPAPTPAPILAPPPPPPAPVASGGSAIRPAVTPVSAPSRPAAASAIPTYASTPAEVAPKPPVPEIDWQRIEQSMREALFRELQPALADEAGRLLRERLQPALERVLLAATAELRQAFDARLRETIARVVAAELARQRDRG